MKKMVLAVVLILGVMLSSLSAVVPVGYKNIDSRIGLNTYISNDGNIMVITANTKKSRITFGVGAESGVNNYGYRAFINQGIESHYNTYGTNNDLYMALNGQFFNMATNPSSLSMHVKIDGDLLQPDIKENKYGQRLFGILSNGIPIIYKGKLKYSNGIQTNKGSIQYQIQKLVKNDVVTDAISGFDPHDPTVKSGPIRASSKTGRNMIGCISYPDMNSESITACKKTLFFVAKKTAHNKLIAEMRKWGIDDSNMVTLDGSHSAQAYSEILENKNSFIFRDKYRKIPNSILIYTK